MRTLQIRFVDADVERFLAKIDKRPNGCWMWTAHKCSRGYGRFGLNGNAQLAHRVSFAMFRGPGADGLELDHICHSDDEDCPGGNQCAHRACVNPWHLEPVSHRENMLRGRTIFAANAQKTHCPQGHPYDELNTLKSGSQRICRTCRSNRDRRRKKGVAR